MKILHSVHPADFRSYDTALIRERFLLDDIEQRDTANFVYTHYDRMVAGVVNPVSKTIPLGNHDNLKSNYFLERREMGIINVGGDGVIVADEKEFVLQKLDCLYLGKGVKEVSFRSSNAEQPAVFFVLSAPAHTSYPSVLMSNQSASRVDLGEQQTANKRTIFKYIHKDGIESCQLVMGLTILHTGSIWNTMPPHTHDRRMEVYFYFDVPEGHRVFHYMGQPDETRHILIGDHQAVVSPPWSIHAGSGTSNYSFIWGMAGENMEFTDMDGIAITDIR
ncbi:MAG TPA: 5-dehydro-4-deoxy-D-glucuronate isomerase [Chitinophagaceae bacterium]|nr:5-dehydro-4-deoxy-D-glucuronate isomerase [Chitinophagaceae bacterium]